MYKSSINIRERWRTKHYLVRLEVVTLVTMGLGHYDSAAIQR